MSSWVETFEAHAVWRTLEEEYEFPEGDGDRDTVEYVTFVAERISIYRKDADPVAFTATMLEEVNGALRNLVNVYSDWRTGGPTSDSNPQRVVAAE